MLNEDCKFDTNIIIASVFKSNPTNLNPLLEAILYKTNKTRIGTDLQFHIMDDCKNEWSILFHFSSFYIFLKITIKLEK